MTIQGATPGGYLERPRPSGLADVIDVILDKGLVIDAYVRVSLIGIEILTSTRAS
jgi:gas vesicle structural protein